MKISWRHSLHRAFRAVPIQTTFSVCIQTQHQTGQPAKAVDLSLVENLVTWSVQRLSTVMFYARLVKYVQATTFWEKCTHWNTSPIMNCIQRINSSATAANWKNRWTKRKEFIIVTFVHLQFALIALLKLRLYGQKKIFNQTNNQMKEKIDLNISLFVRIKTILSLLLK